MRSDNLLLKEALRRELTPRELTPPENLKRPIIFVVLMTVFGTCGVGWE